MHCQSFINNIEHMTNLAPREHAEILAVASGDILRDAGLSGGMFSLQLIAGMRKIDGRSSIRIRRGRGNIQLRAGN